MQETTASVVQSGVMRRTVSAPLPPPPPPAKGQTQTTPLLPPRPLTHAQMPSLPGVVHPHQHVHTQHHLLPTPTTIGAAKTTTTTTTTMMSPQFQFSPTYMPPSFVLPIPTPTPPSFFEQNEPTRIAESLELPQASPAVALMLQIALLHKHFNFSNQIPFLLGLGATICKREIDHRPDKYKQRFAVGVVATHYFDTQVTAYLHNYYRNDSRVLAILDQNPGITTELSKIVDELVKPFFPSGWSTWQ